jgi:hypothetical protein
MLLDDLGRILFRCVSWMSIQWRCGGVVRRKKNVLGEIIEFTLDEEFSMLSESLGETAVVEVLEGRKDKCMI